MKPEVLTPNLSFRIISPNLISLFPDSMALQAFPPQPVLIKGAARPQIPIIKGIHLSSKDRTPIFSVAVGLVGGWLDFVTVAGVFGRVGWRRS